MSKLILDFDDMRPTMDDFEVDLEDMVYNYGKKNQEGIKDALKRAQEYFGCVDSQCQTLIADSFDVETKVVKTLMRFISSIKEEVVECEVVCCSGPRCSKNGSMEVIKTIKSGLGLDFNETRADKKVRLTTKNCFKHCMEGPNVKVNDEFYHNMDKEKAEKLVKEIQEEHGR